MKANADQIIRTKGTIARKDGKGFSTATFIASKSNRIANYAVIRMTSDDMHENTLPTLAQALRLAAPERARLEAAARRPAGSAAEALAEGEQHGVGSRPPLVGRRRELALLEKHLAGEGPPVLLYAGEPGIGKSRLLQQAAQQAPAAGWRVLEGGC